MLKDLLQDLNLSVVTVRATSGTPAKYRGSDDSGSTLYKKLRHEEPHGNHG